MQDSPFRTCADEVENLTKKLMLEVPSLDITQAKKEAAAKAKEEGVPPPADSPKSPSSDGTFHTTSRSGFWLRRWSRRTTKEEDEGALARQEGGGRKPTGEQGRRAAPRSGRDGAVAGQRPWKGAQVGWQRWPAIARASQGGEPEGATRCSAGAVFFFLFVHFELPLIWFHPLEVY